jgi:hypothetical protein
MNGDRRAVATRCRERVLQYYTPDNQRQVIDSTVDGIPASSIVSQARPRTQRSMGGDATAPLALKSTGKSPICELLPRACLTLSGLLARDQRLSVPNDDVP